MQNNQAIPFNKDNFKQIFSVKFLLVITISVPSAIVADYFNLPLAWFLGPMLVTSVGALMGLKIIIPRIVLSSILILLGLYIGNYIDKNLFSQIHEWVFTSLIMLAYIIISIFIVSIYLQKFSKYERKTLVISSNDNKYEFRASSRKNIFKGFEIASRQTNLRKGFESGRLSKSLMVRLQNSSND